MARPGDPTIPSPSDPTSASMSNPPLIPDLPEASSSSSFWVSVPPSRTTIGKTRTTEVLAGGSKED
ncbi:hypothetical protein ColTof4_14039 [Colletotrichum tofieldiae]|nr:hypothetical protein ColTof3_14674 [Colletotrichum tofieldiae]GKT81616.1 hypothetical protein ColTof4_14039 [Colletotrichum tofieldiae]GKT97590.1 hypothetical protein Ct61P_15440 [Colletotrichum tofieldiae]